jgi:hypothetical protein
LISRRNFLKFGVFTGAAFLLDSLIIEPRSIRVEDHAVKVRGLPSAFQGFTICQITDVHLSPMVSLPYLEEVVDTALGLKPDLVALTGDYIDEDKKYMHPAAKSLSRLRARHGVVSVLGNHDHFFGKGFASDVITSNGIQLLDNAHVMIEKGGSALCVAGVADYIEDHPDPAKALKDVDQEVPRVLLAHHPDFAETLKDGLRVDLVLSGHTHGGQVRLPFSIAPVVPSMYGQKYSGGLVELKKAHDHTTRVYVSRGVGVCMIPVRFNCPPELTLIRLMPEGPVAT